MKRRRRDLEDLMETNFNVNPVERSRFSRDAISVYTMTAHLAGALGRKTSTLLPVEADWRWMPIIESLAIELKEIVSTQ